MDCLDYLTDFYSLTIFTLIPPFTSIVGFQAESGEDNRASHVQELLKCLYNLGYKDMPNIPRS